jgi:hypothetical protein
MRTIITLASLGLVLGLGSAAIAESGERYASRAVENQNYYLHKRFYRQNEDRARPDHSGTTRLPAPDGAGTVSPDGIGTASPDARKPVVLPEPVVRG